ncbi:MAG: TolC family protein, partial [Kofleriaceae bacterium]
DANLAHVALVRAKAAVRSAPSARAIAIGRLAALVGAAAGDVVTVRGDLAAPAPDVARIAERADVRVLGAERDVARAELARAVANGRPELGLWAAYQREDTATVVLGGVRMSLPVWNRNQGEKAAARAKERRAGETRDATLRVASRQLADALAAFTDAKLAVETFERDALPILDDSDGLLEKSVDAGQIAVSAYLVARQELLDGRREHLDRLLGLARAAVEVRFAAGVTP